VRVGRRAIAHVNIVIDVSLQHALLPLAEMENLSKRCSCILPCNIALGGVRATFKKVKVSFDNYLWKSQKCKATIPELVIQITNVSQTYKIHVARPAMARSPQRRD
jgi:hypothetical protein